jgi:hypothetical protein
MYREKIKKIAIVDFDVHHGNGTEEIVKFLQKSKISIKNENKICSMTIEKSVCNPWLDYDDSNDVLFVSLHGFDEEYPSMFYPSSGSLQDNTSKDSDIYPGGILNVPINKLTKFSHMYRNLFRARVIPRLIKFKPDLILISAGFDGHEHEEINNSYMSLTEFDYRWMTEELMKIAKKYSEGRLISVLEGGYNINSGVVSSFAQSVMTHTKFINICANKNSEECRIFTKIKRKREFERDSENYKNLKKFRKGSEEDVVLDPFYEEPKFDKNRLRSTRSRPFDQKTSGTEIIVEGSPKLSIEVTPSIIPPINYSKSMTELSFNEIKGMNMDNPYTDLQFEEKENNGNYILF